MAEKDFEILIRYNKWNVEVYDSKDCLLAELKRKSNSWFTSSLSSTTTINGNVFSILNDNESISLTLNDLTIGQVTINRKGLFGLIAHIEIKDERYSLARETLKSDYVLTDKNDNNFISIGYKNYKDKQKNLFGKVFFDDKQYYSVFLSKPTTDKAKLLYLLTLCGYCIRLFSQTDFGEFGGLSISETKTSR